MTVEEKADEIREILEKWVEQNGVLSAGEQLVFTLSVRKLPVVVREEVVDVLTMNVRDFFLDSRRFAKAGFPNSSTRALNAIFRLTDYGSGEWKKVQSLTVRELSEWEPFRQAMRGSHWNNVGVKTKEAIRKVLSDVGIEV